MENKLPNSWATSELGKITDNQKGKLPKKFSDSPQDGFLPYIDIKAFEKGKIERYATTEKTTVTSPNDILVVWDGARFGLSGLGVDGVVGSTLVRIYSELLDTKYLYYFIHSNYGYINSRPRGTGTPHVEPSIFWPLKVPIAPANEQKRIVDKIEMLFSDLDKGEELVKQVQKQLATYRHSVLKAAVTGKLTKDWREHNKHKLEPGEKRLEHILKSRRENWKGRGKYKEPDKLNVKNVSELPKTWNWISVEQILSETLSNGRSVPDATKGFPVLRLTALKNGTIDISERKIGAWTAEEAKPYLITVGDFLVSRGNGSKHLVGRGGLISTNPDLVAYPDTLIRIRVNQDFCNKEYFSCIWNSYFVRQQIEAKAKTTAGIYKINQGDICSFYLPLPPKQEQEEIVDLVADIFSQIDAMEKWCEAGLKRSSTLRQSILKDAFSGKLVPQDPADEPASELLKRIQAEQDNKPKATRGRKTKKARAG